MSTLEMGRISTKIDSAGGVDIIHEYYNAGEKDIKYITFSYIPFNSVNDLVASTIDGKTEVRGKLTGPISAKHKGGVVWDRMWYNPTVSKIAVTGIHIQFMDNTEEVIEGKDIVFMEDENSAYYNEVEKHREPLANALLALGKAESSRKEILKRNSLPATENDYIKSKVKVTEEEYINKAVGASAEEYAIKVLPPIPDEKPTSERVKKPSSQKLIRTDGIFAVLLIAGIVLFIGSMVSYTLATAAGIAIIAAIIFFFISKSKHKEWKSDSEKYAADQRRVEENVKFNKNRPQLIAEREAKLPTVLKEYPQKVDAARAEYLEKVDAARAEYQNKMTELNDTLAPFNKTIETNLAIVESKGYAFPKEYFYFAEHLGYEIKLRRADNVVEAVNKMFKEHPDWAILLK